MLRFAPSPQGDMDISNLRIAIFNYIVTQQRESQLLIRIDDIGIEENMQGQDTEMMMILEKFALKHDSVFHQSEHLNLHQTLAIRLLQEGKAFICQCSDQNSLENYSGPCETLDSEAYTTLKKSGKKFVIRIKKPSSDIVFNDLYHGEISTTPSEVDSFIILDEHGKPTPNFACAADDMMSDIDFILREEKHLENTAKQIHIKNLLGYENTTQYAHMANIIEASNPAEKSYLSLKLLLQEGYLPNSILNYLILLENDKAPKDIFTLTEAIEWFDITTFNTTPLKMDLDKLNQINREQILQLDNKELSKVFGFADADIGELAKLYLSECNTLNELEKKIRPIFMPKDFSGELKDEMQQLSDLIFNAPVFKTFLEFETYLKEKSKLDDTILEKVLKLLLTASESGPELSEVYPLIKSYILEVAS